MIDAGRAHDESTRVCEQLASAEIEHRLVEIESYLLAAIARGPYSFELPLEPFRGAFAENMLGRKLEALGYKVEQCSRRGHAPTFRVSWGGAR